MSRIQGKQYQDLTQALTKAQEAWKIPQSGKLDTATLHMIMKYSGDNTSDGYSSVQLKNIISSSPDQFKDLKYVIKIKVYANRDVETFAHLYDYSKPTSKAEDEGESDLLTFRVRTHGQFNDKTGEALNQFLPNGNTPTGLYTARLIVKEDREQTSQIQLMEGIAGNAKLLQIGSSSSGRAESLYISSYGLNSQHTESNKLHDTNGSINIKKEDMLKLSALLTKVSQVTASNNPNSANSLSTKTSLVTASNNNNNPTSANPLLTKTSQVTASNNNNNPNSANREGAKEVDGSGMVEIEEKDEYEKGILSINRAVAVLGGPKVEWKGGDEEGRKRMKGVMEGMIKISNILKEILKTMEGSYKSDPIPNRNQPNKTGSNTTELNKNRGVKGYVYNIIMLVKYVKEGVEILKEDEGKEVVTNMKNVGEKSVNLFKRLLVYYSHGNALKNAEMKAKWVKSVRSAIEEAKSGSSLLFTCVAKCFRNANSTSSSSSSGSERRVLPNPLNPNTNNSNLSATRVAQNTNNNNVTRATSQNNNSKIEVLVSIEFDPKWNGGIPIIKTQRLVLLPIEESVDLMPIFNLMTKNQSMYKHWEGGIVQNLESWQTRIKQYETKWNSWKEDNKREPKWLSWRTVRLRDTNEFIGFEGLVFFVETKKVEVCFAIDEKYWNQGYATETLKATIMGDLYPILNEFDHIITVPVSEENSASIHLLKKLGFVEGEKIEPGTQQQQQQQQQLYKLSRTDLYYSRFDWLKVLDTTN